MALNARLNLRQTQSLKMTPQLLQSIKLLQFTQLELEQFIESQVESNPLLRQASASDDSYTDRDNGAADSQSNASAERNTDWDNADLEVSAAAISDKLDSSLENIFPDDPGNGDGALPAQMQHDNNITNSLPGLPSSSAPDDDFMLENVAQSRLTLRDVIEQQTPFIFRTIPDNAIASELIDALDERGYVDFDLAGICERLSCDREDVLAVLESLQTCDPAGVFARDLSECLRLQCARNERLDPAMSKLLDNLDLLAKRDFKTLSQICGVDDSDLLDMLAEIKRLDPRPGLQFELSGTQAIVHDVEVAQTPDGNWRIELNSDALPKVIVDRQYYNEISGAKLKKDEKSFIADCLASATWLERSLDQRAITILKVTTEIVKQQDGFFLNGVSSLKPMTMKMVADAIEMHESTVSRVASNKYMMTPRGLFELRYFFTVAISGVAGGSDDHSSESVKQRIRDLIKDESVQKVLSDDALVDALREEGIEIARRTVAKYREAMNIASSVQRRREKKAQLTSEKKQH
ncbi:RNA polymerase factor sigma-54 [Ahrensia kielensis]|uniref:RNA polymerase sigma-54 factor n=1 Tax=Ahrensia kielensis TaxID=76980 RepID=A0ABU9T9H9_9HYPH